MGPPLRGGRSWAACPLRQGGAGARLSGLPCVGIRPERRGYPRAPQFLRPPRARHGAALNGRGWRTGGFRPRRAGRACDPSPSPPCRSAHLLLEEMACLGPSRASTAFAPRPCCGWRCRVWTGSSRVCIPASPWQCLHAPAPHPHRTRADASRPRCSPANPSFAAFGQRRSCRGPRWAETRHLPPTKPAHDRAGRGLDRRRDRRDAGGSPRSASHAT